MIFISHHSSNAQIYCSADLECIPYTRYANSPLRRSSHGERRTIGEPRPVQKLVSQTCVSISGAVVRYTFKALLFSSALSWGFPRLLLFLPGHFLFGLRFFLNCQKA